jgi:hypothetical protein
MSISFEDFPSKLKEEIGAIESYLASRLEMEIEAID